MDEFETLTDCICERVIIIDERAVGLGYRCVKCGRSADHRLDEFKRQIHGGTIPLTEEERWRIKIQIRKALNAKYKGEIVNA